MKTTERSLLCISQTTGSGGKEIGQGVAERLGLRYVDDEIIRLAAERARVDPSTVAEAEWPKPLLMRLADAIDDLPSAVTAPSQWLSKPSQKALRSLIRETVASVAERGNAVIVAHAASIALGPRRDLLRVLVSAPPDIRAERLRASGLFLAADAAAEIEQSDRNRLQYMESFYGVREETPLHYDLVINTEQLSVDQAVGAIAAAARG